MARFTGSCRCGNVLIKAKADPDRVGICHCQDCRKYHGALFHASAIFLESDVTILGETSEYEGRSFCPRCGSPVFSKTDDEIEITLGAFDNTEQFIPTYELWTSRRETWLPKFTLTKKYQRNQENEN